jgi:predicted amidophosphoribosyltransferase
MTKLNIYQSVCTLEMTGSSERLRECPDCERVFNVRVNQGQCPKCGAEIPSKA